MRILNDRRPLGPGRATILACLGVAALLVGCGGGDAGNTPTETAEPQTASQNYDQFCSSCHGDDGEGGIGPKLGDGVVAESLSHEDHIEVIEDGRGSMQGFSSKLTKEEIEDLADYEREDLGTE